MSDSNNMKIRADNVIDNKEVVLSDELIKHFSHTEEADIAVGYFFISGIAPLIDSLKKIKKIRLLISNTTDRITAETLIEGFQRIKEVQNKLDKGTQNNDDKRENILQSAKQDVQKSLEYMTQTKAEGTLIENLIEMMQSGQIQVRIYPKEKLHAKAYLLRLTEGLGTEGIGIVGSSNLSLAGISRNTELNLKTRAPSDYNQLVEWFDGLWGIGIDSTNDFKILFEQSWAGTPYSGQDLFYKALYVEYGLGIEGRHEIDPIWAKKLPDLFDFQEQAVKNSLTRLEDYNGVIIGDVVGLGKTYIGITLLKYLQIQNYRALIICPPALMRMWEIFCEEYEVDAKIMSRGDLSKSNYDLVNDYRYRNRDLVLVDESHHFRRNTTRQYENLKKFMDRGECRAILLTATPLANKEDDIKHQLMLFHMSEKTNIPAAADIGLNAYFKKVNKGEASLVDLLRYVMIRRMRKDVVAQSGGTDEGGRSYILLKNERRYFPKRKLSTQRYDIDHAYQGNYSAIIKLLNENNLTLARYNLGKYVKDEYREIELYENLNHTVNLIGLIRTLLLKRMESSIKAFQDSIGRYIKTHESFLKVIKEKNVIPIGDRSYKKMYDIAKDDYDAPIDDESLAELEQMAEESNYKIVAFNIDNLVQDIENDVGIFKQIKEYIDDLDHGNDDKFFRLQQLLNGKYSGKKILIFSEFSSTIDYLRRNLNWDGEMDWTDSKKGNSIECARRFDPKNNPSTEKITKETTLLLSTDVLAEGVNLQAGEVIINYDFHWNPTRLIQRAGRVDRIGSENQEVIIHNFLLDPEMEDDFDLQKNVKAKIAKIQEVIGEEYKILGPDDKINTTNHYLIYGENEGIFDEGMNLLEPSSGEKILTDIKNNKHELWTRIKNMSNGIRCSDGTLSGGSLLLVCAIGTIHKYYHVYSTGNVIVRKPSYALKLLRSESNSIHQLPPDYDDLLARGWERFKKDSDQMLAGHNVQKPDRIQKHILERLSDIAKKNTTNIDLTSIDTLRKAFSQPIRIGNMKRDLSSIKKANHSDSDLIDALNNIYRNYNLQQEKSVEEEYHKIPKILYSKYIGDPVE